MHKMAVHMWETAGEEAERIGEGRARARARARARIRVGEVNAGPLVPLCCHIALQVNNLICNYPQVNPSLADCATCRTDAKAVSWTRLGMLSRCPKSACQYLRIRVL